jgi:hypothetical protein
MVFGDYAGWLRRGCVGEKGKLTCGYRGFRDRKDGVWGYKKNAGEKIDCRDDDNPVGFFSQGYLTLCCTVLPVE